MKRISGKHVIGLVAGVLLLSGATSVVLSHCEIPCGIYGDPGRLDLMAEHITTIEKSMKQIQDLSAAGQKNHNQLVRWVGNKEQHADAFSDIITQYFLTQRVKPVGEEDAQAYRAYVFKLSLLHEMLVFSMKAKQSADPGVVERLESLLEQLHSAYFGE